MRGCITHAHKSFNHFQPEKHFVKTSFNDIKCIAVSAIFSVKFEVWCQTAQPFASVMDWSNNSLLHVLKIHTADSYADVS